MACRGIGVLEIRSLNKKNCSCMMLSKGIYNNKILNKKKKNLLEIVILIYCFKSLHEFQN